MKGVTDAIIPSLIDLCNNIDIEEININGSAITSPWIVDPVYARSMMSPDFSIFNLSNR